MDLRGDRIEREREAAPGLRDLLACHALTAIIANVGLHNTAAAAVQAYAIADAMMAERKKNAGK